MHIYQTHKMTTKEYKKEFGLDTKKGILPEDLRKLKAKKVFENKTIENLKKGRKFWFKKGSKTAGKYPRSQQSIKRLTKQINKYRFNEKKV